MKLKESEWSVKKIKEAVDRAFNDEGAFLFIKESNGYISLVLLANEQDNQFSFLELHENVTLHSQKMFISRKQVIYSSFIDFIKGLNIQIIFINKEIKNEMLKYRENSIPFLTILKKIFPEYLI